MATILSAIVAASLLTAPKGSQVIDAHVGDVEIVEGAGISGFTFPSPDTDFTHVEIDGRELNIYAPAAPETLLQTVTD